MSDIHHITHVLYGAVMMITKNVIPIQKFRFRIWKGIMSRVHENLETKDFVMPSSVEQKSVCTISGYLANSSCPSVTEYFATDSLPDQSCPGHKKHSEDYDSEENDSKSHDTNSDNTGNNTGTNTGDNTGGTTGGTTGGNTGGNTGGGDAGGGNTGGGDTGGNTGGGDTGGNTGGGDAGGNTQ